MRALQIANPRAIKLAVQKEVRRSAESRYDHRLHAVLLVCQGHNCSAVGTWLGEHPATVQRWVHRFAAGGCAGLRERARAGRPRRLSGPAWAKVEQDLRVHPRDLGYDQSLWDGKLLARHLRQKYQLHLGTRQCQRFLRRLGSRRRQPRLRMASSEAAARRV